MSIGTGVVGIMGWLAWLEHGDLGDWDETLFIGKKRDDSMTYLLEHPCSVKT